MPLQRLLLRLQKRSQSQLTQLTGIPEATLYAIENGRVNPGL